MKKYTKDRLFEMMSKVDNKFQINEYDNFNYPAGADANPNAPWNQTDDSISDIEINYDKRYPYTFTIEVHSKNGAYATYDGFNLLDRSKDQELHNFFDEYGDTKELSFNTVNSPEFINMAKKLFYDVIGDNVEWEYDESIDETTVNPEDAYSIQTSQLPIKLYCGNHLGNTASYLSQNMAYIHWFDADRDNYIICYTVPSKSDELVYEFDVQKMIKLGFKVNRNDDRDMRNMWIVIPPKNYAHKNTIRFIDEYMTKVIVDMSSFDLIYDINNKLDFIKKFGMPTVPMEIKENNNNVSTSKLPDYNLNEKKV